MSNSFWSVITLVGLFGWVSCMLGFLLKSFPGRDLFEVKSAYRWGGAVLVTYTIWIVGMLNA